MQVFLERGAVYFGEMLCNYGQFSSSEREIHVKTRSDILQGQALFRGVKQLRIKRKKDLTKKEKKKKKKRKKEKKKRRKKEKKKKRKKEKKKKRKKEKKKKRKREKQ